MRQEDIAQQARWSYAIKWSSYKMLELLLLKAFL